SVAITVTSSIPTGFSRWPPASVLPTRAVPVSFASRALSAAYTFFVLRSSLSMPPLKPTEPAAILSFGRVRGGEEF
ncbi:MAG: hypothetical protein KA158_10910, partial [Leucobacter sp.]|nr:hypothetical protein [Leucobacter sp.]